MTSRIHHKCVRAICEYQHTSKGSTYLKVFGISGCDFNSIQLPVSIHVIIRSKIPIVNEVVIAAIPILFVVIVIIIVVVIIVLTVVVVDIVIIVPASFVESFRNGIRAATLARVEWRSEGHFA